MGSWVCSQFGARENYAVPRALHRRNALAQLITDIWLPPSSFVSKLAPVSSRFHSDVPNDKVTSFNSTFLSRHLARKAGFGIHDDDQLYDRLVSSAISKGNKRADVFFGYSYSSLSSMQSAKEKGYRTILGQINPGPAEADIVKQAFKEFQNGKYPATVPDNAYWDRWRKEVEASDRLIVNSEWSSELLLKSGVPSNKLVVVPLAYAPGQEFSIRKFSERFDHSDPLKLLYLGGVGIRKGFHILVEAMRKLDRSPVVLDVVGSLKGPKELLEHLPANIRYHGHAQKEQTETFYRNADVMIFPTLSDGFGLVQLEAQARKLPLIVSNNCARVIQNDKNGIVLNEVTARAIVDAVTKVIEQPGILPSFSANSVSMKDYDLDMLADRLVSLD